MIILWGNLCNHHIDRFVELGDVRMLDFDKFSKTGEFILYLVDLFDACSVVIFLLVEKDLFNLTLPLCFI